jgi:hypothetical protein
MVQTYSSVNDAVVSIVCVSCIFLFGMFSVLAFFRIRKSGKVWVGGRPSSRPIVLVHGGKAISVARQYLVYGIIALIFSGGFFYIVIKYGILLGR